MVLLDKPAGPTSHDLVARARRALGTRAVGHAGTLDPFATGLLVLLIGKATRLARFAGNQPKTYLATAVLGERTDTDDATGTALPGGPGPVPVDRAEVARAIARFRGTAPQRPPAFSAKKVGGVASYRRARRGEAVALAPVDVTVHAIELADWTPPRVTFRATVSAGTYIRALARDLGEALGCGAHLVALRREAIGALRVEEAVPPEAVGPTAVLPARRAVAHLPAVELDGVAAAAVAHGRPVPGGAGLEGHVALLAGGELAAVARAEGGVLRPEVVLS
ncbi:MAG TPA: tRNA pseudouridine(55) synthase TruB [Gemmatimonadales bacterium]|nr:tRNA pseudouridine(55) synthase TruB [Gemmatimonadales bacterium]